MSVEFTFASLLASILLAVPSRSFFAVAAALPTKTESHLSPMLVRIATDEESDRYLFELPSPFDFVNDQCARACNSQEEHVEENDEGPFINPCPKCHGQYTPCNFCCYQGASSLKFRFFGCPGNTSIVFHEVPGANGCDNWVSNNTVSNGIEIGVKFVDCDCFDNATDISSSSFGDISSCALFDYEVFGSSSPHLAASSFDLCVVSTTDSGVGHVANFSQPLPDVIGLKHVPNGRAPDSVTFFETTCDEKGVDSLGNFAYPLFPGYGKFAGTCPYNGYIDFENGKSRLPSDIAFVGQPPSTSFFYQFIDGTSVGFWPNTNDQSDDDGTDESLFFSPTFASCDCVDCNVIESITPSDSLSDPPTSDPMSPTDGTPDQPDFGTNEPSSSFSDFPSQSPSTNPSIESSNVPSTIDPSSPPSSGPTVRPSLLSSENPSESPTSKVIIPSFSPSTNPSKHPSEMPSVRPSLSPIENPSESPSSSYYPSFSPSNAPSKSITPSFFPSISPSNYLTKFPSVFPSLPPSENPSESPSSSYYPSINPSGVPSRSLKPSVSPSINPSDHPTKLFSVGPSHSPSENLSQSPSSSYYPSNAPSENPSKSMTPSVSPSTNPSEHPSAHPTRSPSEVPSSAFSESPTTFHPITYRCPPTSFPTQTNIPVTPSPFHAPFTTPAHPTSNPSAIPTGLPTASTQSPTEEVSTESPTNLQTTSSPTENHTDVGCVDEAGCFIFAVANCVDKNTHAICIPHMNGGFRRFLETQIRFHQAALAELQQQQQEDKW